MTIIQLALRSHNLIRICAVKIVLSKYLILQRILSIEEIIHILDGFLLELFRTVFFGIQRTALSYKISHDFRFNRYFVDFIDQFAKQFTLHHFGVK